MRRAEKSTILGMNEMKRITTVLTCLILAGCEAPTNSASSVSFTDDSGTQFLAAQVPVSVQLLGPGDPNSTYTEYGNGKEKVDGKCTIREDRYTVSLTVPGKVNIPAYSQGARPIAVSCTYDGREINKTLQPVNLSRKARQNTNVGLALLCPVCGLGSAMAGSGQGPNRSGDIYGFDRIVLDIE